MVSRLFRHRSSKISKLCITGLCEGNRLVTIGFPSQRASNTEIDSIWWDHHVQYVSNGVTAVLKSKPSTCDIMGLILSYVAVIVIKKQLICRLHDDVIKWKHFSRYWPFVRGIHRSPVNSSHKGQWRGTLMVSSIRTLMNCWVNNNEAGDLRRHHAHYDITIMSCFYGIWCSNTLKPKSSFQPMKI